MADSSGTGYGGQGGLNEATDDFNVIAFIVEQMIAKVGTMKLVKVTAAKSAGELAKAGTVDVQILVDQMDGLGKTTKSGEVFGIPYFRFSGGTGGIVLDPAVGDIGLMFCADRDISGALAKGDRAPPGSFRRHDAADGVYLGGISNAVPKQYLRFFATGLELVDTNGNKLTSGPTGWAFQGPVAVNGALQLGGGIQAIGGGIYNQKIVTSADSQTINGDVSAGTTTLKSHVHQANGATALTGPARAP